LFQLPRPSQPDRDKDPVRGVQAISSIPDGLVPARKERLPKLQFEMRFVPKPHQGIRWNFFKSITLFFYVAIMPMSEKGLLAGSPSDRRGLPHTQLGVSSPSWGF